MLKLKENVTIEDLRKYGFELGSILGKKATFQRYGLGTMGYSYMDNWVHKFLMEEEEPDKIAFTDDNFDIPMVHMAFRFGKSYNGKDFVGDLYVDVAPSCDYSIGGSELDIVTDTIYQMTIDGLLEMKEER